MDNLGNLKKEIKEYAQQKNIKVLDGSLSLEKSRCFDVDVGEDWKSFINFVSNYESSFLILNEVDMGEETGEESFEFVDNLEDYENNDDFSQLIKQVRQLIEQAKGKVFSVSVSWIYQGKIIAKNIEADWFREILGLVSQINSKLILYRDENKKCCEVCGKELDEFTLQTINEGDPLKCGMCKRALSVEEREKLEKEADRIADDLSKDKIFVSSKLNVQKLYVEKGYSNIPKSKVAYIVDRARGLAEISKKGTL